MNQTKFTETPSKTIQAAIKTAGARGTVEDKKLAKGYAASTNSLIADTLAKMGR